MAEVKQVNAFLVGVYLRFAILPGGECDHCSEEGPRCSKGSAGRDGFIFEKRLCWACARDLLGEETLSWGTGC
jgi:hypothetical protein